MESGWKEVGELDALCPRSGLAPLKCDEHQLVLARTEEGGVFALDNRCPHEGYPLAQGGLKDCTLTCRWHNWKFDVRDGSCTLGGEAVRSFPTRVRDGVLSVDLSDPETEELFPVLLQSLDEGLFRHENGRALRDAVRLLQLGYEPRRLLADVALYDARHAEYGSTHVLALAADCARLLGRYRGAEALHAIAPVIDMCGDANRRLPVRERPPALTGGNAAVLRRAIEEEDASHAEGLLRGAFEAGSPRREIENWLFAAISDHFTDFGHQLIYMLKTGELLDEITGTDAAEVAPELYGSLVYSAVLATREDELPYMLGYSERFESIRAELRTLHRGGAADDEPAPPCDVNAVSSAVLDARPDEASETVWNALRSGASAASVAEALVIAASERLLRFDLAVDRDPDLAETWLWATHRLTFASAVRKAQDRFDDPDALSFLFQALAFIHSGRKMDAPEADRVRIRAGSPWSAEPADVDEVIRAIGARDTQHALDGTLSLLRAGEDARHRLRAALEDLCLTSALVRPIVVAHAIKTAQAAFDEYEALTSRGYIEPELCELPLLATVRFLASPIVERRVHDAAHTSIGWVVEGRVPRKLTQ